jgi:hypothetical protein
MLRVNAPKQYTQLALTVRVVAQLESDVRRSIGNKDDLSYYLSQWNEYRAILGAWKQAYKNPNTLVKYPGSGTTQWVMVTNTGIEVRITPVYTHWNKESKYVLAYGWGHDTQVHYTANTQKALIVRDILSKLPE